MGKDTYRGPLEPVDPCCWRIPKSYKQGMRVDGLIFASQKLMEQLKLDQAPEQVANVAFLPGIQGASLAMPDIHWGYGFPIGGVAATDPEEGGVITPGGIGFDINCLCNETCVTHSLGYTRRIGDMADEWRNSELACYALGEAKPTATTIARWFAQKPLRAVVRIVTESGDSIRATSDHPFWTPDGMVKAGNLNSGDRVAMAPFRGVPYEEPSDEVIVSEKTIAAKCAALGKTTGGNGLKQILSFLKACDLLPLRYSSPALPYLCKILGFVFGDGTIHFAGGMGKGVVHF